MSKEDQRASAERILAKEPMTEEELERMRFLTMPVEDYPVPDAARMKAAEKYWKTL